jgi:hypothetical protein
LTSISCIFGSYSSDRTVVKLAMQSLSEALITSKQAKDMLSKIEDESAKAEFIGNIIV